MTAEHRLFFELSDILAVVFECKHCKLRLSVVPEKLRPERVQQCPGCSRDWLNADATNAAGMTHPVARLLSVLGPAIANADNLGARVMLEFNHPRP